jgi:hypothetical protein
VKNNRIHDSAYRGVRAYGSFSLEYNLIYGNAEVGCFLYNNGVEADIYNNVFYGNWRGLVIASYDVDADVKNNIFSGNADVALYQTSLGMVTDSHNCVDGSYSGTWQRKSNVDQSPRFTAPGVGDFSLQADSPCIDAGVDLGIETDFLGDPPYDVPQVPNTGNVGQYALDYVDMGAIEFR